MKRIISLLLILSLFPAVAFGQNQTDDKKRQNEQKKLDAQRKKEEKKKLEDQKKLEAKQKKEEQKKLDDQNKQEAKKKKDDKKKYQRPRIVAPDALDRSAPPTQPDPKAIADLKWFEIFKDEKLQELVHEALVYNYDVREAVARVDAARANLGIAKADRYPTIGAGGEVVYEHRSRDGQFTVPEPVNQDRTFGSILGSLLTYEIDVWGRIKKANEAAKAELLATEETRRAVTTTLIGDVTAAYFNLRELDFELGIARRTLDSRLSTLRIITLRQEYGVSTMLERRQAEELVYSATEVIPRLEQEIERNENLISYLTGKNPQAIPRGRTLTEQELPPEVPAGLPSDLIERRPDIRSAEQELIAANARIEVAKKAFFPKISITGFFGWESVQLQSLFTPSRAVWGFIPQITQPLFTGGRLKNNVRLTEAQKNLLLVNYERTIQNAFREVSDSLIAYRKSKEIRAQRENLVVTLRDRSRLAYMRYTGGVASLLEALDSDRELFDAELSLAKVRRDELLTVVQLYKSLGGGWQ
jgi:outer membrane protein, multidrug efflux system